MAELSQNPSLPLPAPAAKVRAAVGTLDTILSPPIASAKFDLYHIMDFHLHQRIHFFVISEIHL